MATVLKNIFFIVVLAITLLGAQALTFAQTSTSNPAVTVQQISEGGGLGTVQTIQIARQKSIGLYDKITSRLSGSVFIELPNDSALSATTAQFINLPDQLAGISGETLLYAIAEGLHLTRAALPTQNGKAVQGFLYSPIRGNKINKCLAALADLKEPFLLKAMTSGLNISELDESQREQLLEAGFGNTSNSVDIVSGSGSITLRLGLVGHTPGQDAYSSRSLFQLPLSDKEQQRILAQKQPTSTLQDEIKPQNQIFRSDRGRICTLDDLWKKILKDQKRIIAYDPRLSDTLVYIRGALTPDQEVAVLSKIGLTFTPFEVPLSEKIDPSKESKLLNLLVSKVGKSDYLKGLMTGSQPLANLNELLSSGLTQVFGNSNSSVQLDGLRLIVTYTGNSGADVMVGSTIPLSNRP